MNYLLPQEDDLIQFYLCHYHQRLSKFKIIFKQNKNREGGINVVFGTIRKEIYLFMIVIVAFIKHRLPLFYSDKHFLDSQTLSLLLIKYLHLDSIAILAENDSLEKDAYYTAARYYLEDYLLEEQEIEQTNNLDRVEGYLQAFENLCEIQDWKRAKKIINLYLESNTPLSLKRLFNILKNWGYDKKANDLYFQLWEYSYTNSDYSYFIELGNVLTSLDKYKNAIDCYLTALKITKSKNKNFERTHFCYNGLGRLYCKLGNYQSAIKYHKKSLSIIKLIEKNKSCWQKLSQKWKSFWYQYSFLTSIIKLISVIAIIVLPAIGGSTSQEIFILIIIVFFNTLPDDTISPEYNSLADTLNQLGDVYDQIKDYETALKYYQDVLNDVFKNKKNSSELIDAYLKVGDVYLKIGNAQDSIIYYQKALEITHNRLLYDKLIKEGDILQRLGNAYVTIQDYSEAKKLYIKALSSFKKSEYKNGEALVLNYLGIVHFYLGKYQKAIKYYQEALPIYQENENQASESVVINNLAIANEYWKNEQNQQES
jgi:tetratricopeptide (TPR) repeat protein